jgi:hypothetical protein
MSNPVSGFENKNNFKTTPEGVSAFVNQLPPLDGTSKERFGDAIRTHAVDVPYKRLSPYFIDSESAVTMEVTTPFYIVGHEADQKGGISSLLLARTLAVSGDSDAEAGPSTAFYQADMPTDRFSRWIESSTLRRLSSMVGDATVEARPYSSSGAGAELGERDVRPVSELTQQMIEDYDVAVTLDKLARDFELPMQSETVATGSTV